jgi:hypothetical protein
VVEAGAGRLAAGLFATVPEGYPIVPFGATQVHRMRSVEEARAAATWLVDQDVDVVTIALESGRPSGPSMPIPTREETGAIVETAHPRGIPVVAHAEFSGDLAEVRLVMGGGVVIRNEGIRALKTDSFPPGGG